MLSTSSYELNGILIEYYEQYARIYKNTTCIIRMSKRPTNTVTDTRRSKTVLNKSADVLHHLASVTTIKITSNTPLKYNNESSMEKKIIYIPRIPRNHVQKFRLHLLLLYLLVFFNR
jgi:hypothetical protein